MLSHQEDIKYNCLYNYILENHSKNDCPFIHNSFLLKFVDTGKANKTIEVHDQDYIPINLFKAEGFVLSQHFLFLVDEVHNTHDTYMMYIEVYEHTENKESISILSHFDRNGFLKNIELKSKIIKELTHIHKVDLKYNSARLVNYMMYVVGWQLTTCDQLQDQAFNMKFDIYKHLKRVKSKNDCVKLISTVKQYINILNSFYRYSGVYDARREDMQKFLEKLNELYQNINATLAEKDPSFQAGSTRAVVLQRITSDLSKAQMRLETIKCATISDLVHRFQILHNINNLACEIIQHNLYLDDELSILLESILLLEEKIYFNHDILILLLGATYKNDINSFKIVQENAYLFFDFSLNYLRMYLVKLLDFPLLSFEKFIPFIDLLYNHVPTFSVSIWTLNYYNIKDLDFSILEALDLEHNININNDANKKNSVTRDTGGIAAYSALYICCEYNNIMAFKKLISFGVNPCGFALVLKDENVSLALRSVFLIHAVIFHKMLPLDFFEVLLENNCCFDTENLHDFMVLNFYLASDNTKVSNISDSSLRKLKYSGYALHTLMLVEDFTNSQLLQKISDNSSPIGFLVGLAHILNDVEVENTEVVNFKENFIKLIDIKEVKVNKLEEDNKNSGKNQRIAQGDETKLLVNELKENFISSIKSGTQRGFKICKMVAIYRQNYLEIFNLLFKRFVEVYGYSKSRDEFKNVFQFLYNKLKSFNNIDLFLDYHQSILILFSQLDELYYEHIYVLFDLHILAAERVLEVRKDTRLNPVYVNIAIVNFNLALQLHKLLITVFVKELKEEGKDLDYFDRRLNKFRMKINPFFNSSAHQQGLE